MMAINPPQIGTRPRRARTMARLRTANRRAIGRHFTVTFATAKPAGNRTHLAHGLRGAPIHYRKTPDVAAYFLAKLQYYVNSYRATATLPAQ